MPKANPLVASLPATTPFVGPERLERQNGRLFKARLGANECNFGASPKAVEAMDRAAREDVWKYCDPEIWDLRQALAAHCGVATDEIVVGAGIDNLLGTTVRIFSDVGDAIINSDGAYPTFNYHVNGFGRRLVTVPYRQDREDLLALSEAARRENAKIVYLSNPDNPMGTWWDASEITRFVEAVPEDTLIILDEAYGETAPAGTLPPITLMRPNLLRYRTFSKAYGLAGMRVGYAIGAPRTIAGFDRIRNHFGVTKLSQIAATAALADQDYLARTIAAIAAGRDEIISRTKTLGLKPIPSATNFVAIDCGADDTYATMLLNGMQARGIFIRKPAAPGLNRCIRMSVGTPKDIALACDVLEDIIKTENR